MDYAEYKRFHESHMLNNTGSTIWETGLVLASIPVGTFLSLWLAPSLHFFLVPINEFLILIFPVILGVTILSDAVYMIPLYMVLLSVAIFMLRLKLANFKNVWNSKLTSRKCYITNYRASTNFVSVLCILAVDFAIFPKKFAKTDMFGYGLMDLGVGFYVCANGIVVKQLKSTQDLFKTLKATSALVTLGIIRLLSTKSVDYHEHVSEYGAHWNFFFTLAFCKLFADIVVASTKCVNPFFLTVMTAAIHQAMLLFGLQEWIFSDIPRDSFLTANREGLTSSFGYVSLYFAAVSLGRVINNIPQSKTRGTLLLHLLLVCGLSWLGTIVCDRTIGISRRLANIGYTFWIISLSITKIIQFMISEIAFCTIQKKNKSNENCVPVLLESINANGLFYFLLANVLTGIINLLFQTLLLDTPTSIFIITLYMIVTCLISLVLYHRKIILKFW